MTAAWVRVEERLDRAEEVGGAVSYMCRFAITQAYAVPNALFVFRADDGTYSHVATIDDIANWPISRDAAVEANHTFFRASEVTLPAPSRRALAALSLHVRRRLQEVAEAWDPEVPPLEVPGTNTYTLGGDP